MRGTYDRGSGRLMEEDDEKVARNRRPPRRGPLGSTPTRSGAWNLCGVAKRSRRIRSAHPFTRDPVRFLACVRCESWSVSPAVAPGPSQPMLRNSECSSLCVASDGSSSEVGASYRLALCEAVGVPPRSCRQAHGTDCSPQGSLAVPTQSARSVGILLFQARWLESCASRRRLRRVETRDRAFRIRCP